MNLWADGQNYASSSTIMHRFLAEDVLSHQLNRTRAEREDTKSHGE